MKLERLKELAGTNTPLNETPEDAEKILQRLFKELRRLEKQEAPDEAYFQFGNDLYNQLKKRGYK